MLFRNSLIITHTKKLFKRSIKSFKSFLSNGYTKLPKSPPCHCTLNPFSCIRGGISNMKFSHSYRELDSFHAEIKETVTNDICRRDNIVITQSTPTTKSSRLNNQDSETNVSLFQEEKKRTKGKGKGIGKDEQEIRMILLSEKLKEMEIMDGGNMEYVLDIEEVIHYYSRLTCPTHRGIVDKFFAEMYTEFLCVQAAAAVADSCGINVSRRPVRRPRYVKV